MRIACLLLALATWLCAAVAEAQWPEPPEEELYSEPLMIAGFVLFPISGAVASAGSFWFLVGMGTSCECVAGTECDCGESTALAGIAMMTAGGVCMLGGIAMAIIGTRSAAEMSAAVPDVELGVGSASLSWQF